MPCIRCSAAILLALAFVFVSPFSSSAPIELIVTGSSTWQPFSFINQNNQPDGIMVDYWKQYGKVNNIAITFHLLPWSESLDYAQNSSNVIHGGLGYTSDRAKYLTFSGELPLRPYNVNLFVKKDFPLYELEKLNSTIVGTVKESTKHAFMLSRIPEENIRQYPTFGALKNAAHRGEINVFIDDLSTALYNMRHTGNAGLFTPRRKLYSFPLHFAVGKSFKYNMGKIENDLDNINQKEINAIYNKWLPENNLDTEDFELNKYAQYALLTSALLLLLFGLFSYKNRLTRKTHELTCAVKALNDSKEKLKHAVQNDALTGAKSRHQFFIHLSEKRFSSTPYVVAVVGIDALKQINKIYGQDIGDIALKHLATQLRVQLPANTMLARLGGGEFGISFDNYDLIQATNKLQRIQNTLKQNSLNIDQQLITVQFYTGLACCPDESENIETLVQLATMRMRTTKATASII